MKLGARPELPAGALGPLRGSIGQFSLNGGETMRVTRKDIGKQVVFVGFDNKAYEARIESINRGIVTVAYVVPRHDEPALARLHSGNLDRLVPKA